MVLAGCWMDEGQRECTVRYALGLRSMHQWFAIEVGYLTWEDAASCLISSLQSYWLHLASLPVATKKQWNRRHPRYKNYQRFRYAIAVDKAILKHQIRLAKTPIHTLPYEVIQVVYGYIYGPHSFPSCFFSRFFTPTKGRCLDH